MDDSCAVCAETLEWVAYGACGHKDVCSTCVARLRFICNDRRCCICKTEATAVFVTKALGEYTRMINDFTVFPYEPKEGRISSYWYHEDTQAFFDDLDHYKMIRAMCKLSCSVCDKMEGSDGDGMKKRARFRNIEQLKGHLFHQHKLLMCSLCLEGRKVFICEQKLYTRAQLNQHIDTGDSEVDGTESERGGFMGHPLCEFCRTPFYGDNELYSHMSTEHYTCHICQRQHPGQYEYYKNYDDLEIHFRSNHFLCEDESCLAKKFVVFQSETELKRHNTLEHGGRMSRSQRSAALQIPTSFQYRRSNEQDSRRRGRSFRRDNSENELVMAIQASLEAANADGRPRDTSSNRRVVSDYTETNDEDFLIASFESLATDSVEPASRYRQAVSQASGNSQLQESSFPPLAVPPATNQPRPQSDALPKNTMASRLRRKQNKTTKPSSSSPAWPATGHTPPVIGHQRAWPVVSSASGSSSSSRHSKAATDDPSAPVITTQHAWPAVSGATGSTSGSSQIKLPSSSSRYSKAATDNPSAPVITREHAWPAVGGATGSTSGSSQIKPSTVDGPPPSSYLSSVAALSSLVHEASSSSVGSSKNWYQSNRISHSTSAPNLVQSGSFDSSVSDFPPVSAVQTRKLPASGQQAVTNVEDVQTANKSLVERMRLALQFDQDKFAAFKDISAEYRQGIIDAETYLAYVEQFGLSHLILELARLCPDAERQKELIDTFNANLGGGHKQKELIDTTPLQNFQSGGNQLKDGNSSKKGKGKLLDAGNGTSKGNVADNIISTVRKLQSSHKIPEDDVEVLSKDGYRSTKAKSKLTLSESEELNSRGEPLRLQARQNGLSARDESNHSSGNNDGKSKQRKKTSKFHRVRLGDGSVETLLNLKSSDPDADPDRKETSDEHSDPPEGLPVRGVWRNGGGHKLVAMTSKGPKK